MAQDPGTSMGIGGSGGLFNRKSELVADLTSAFKTLNQELQKTKDLSDAIAKNLGSSKPGGGNNLLSGSMGGSSGTKDASTTDGTGDGSGSTGGSKVNWAGIAKGLLSGGAKVAGLGLQAMPTMQQVLERDASASRVGFFSGAGYGGANNIINGMASAGTATDPMDASRAAMNGTMNGLMPGVNKNAGSSAAMISNLVPGVGLQGGMQVMNSMNQARNVNMAKMFGINIRGADGMMNSFKDIADQLWKIINSQKTGTRALSKKDLAIMLQPGNSLDSIINQYLGPDPLVRSSVVSALLAKAAGSDLSKESLIGIGVTTEALSGKNGVGARNAAASKAIGAAAPFELKGMEEANKALIELNNRFSDLIGHSKALQKILEGKGFLDTMATGGNGAGAGAMGLLGGVLGHAGGFLAKKAFGFGKNIFKWGKSGIRAAETVAEEGVTLAEEVAPEALAVGEVAVEEAAGTAMAPFTGGASLVLTTALAAGTIAETMRHGKDLRAGIKKIGNFFYDSKGNKIDPKTGKPYGTGGQDDLTKPTTTYGKPLSGNPPITSPFGIVRFVQTASGKSASYGKPHGGIDYGVGEGTPLYAVTDGVVGDTPYDSSGFGNYVMINDADGYEAYYGHMTSKAVSGGTKVKAGDLVGYSGNSGNSTGPHLHFEVRKSGQKIDPDIYLKGAGAAAGGDSASPIHGDITGITNLSGSIMPRKGGTGGEGLVSATQPMNKGRGGHEAHGINYGGVHVTINLPEGKYDANEIARVVKHSLEQDKIREKAVSF